MIGIDPQIIKPVIRNQKRVRLKRGCLPGFRQQFSRERMVFLLRRNVTPGKPDIRGIQFCLRMDSFR